MRWMPAMALVAGCLIIAVAASFMFPLHAFAAERCDITGTASYYGFEHHGRRTASGAVFDQWAMTAAMPSRKHLGERWRVTYRGKSVVVTITDLGPHKRLGRAIDLSRGAAAQLGMIEAGVGQVCLKHL